MGLGAGGGSGFPLLLGQKQGLWRCQHLRQVSESLGAFVLSDLEPASCWPLGSHLASVELERTAVRSCVQLGGWRTG